MEKYVWVYVCMYVYSFYKPNVVHILLKNPEKYTVEVG